ncbi:MAG: DUF2972 domain-containing protein, partial [Helicobacter sp.]|nr:DUF2972 domain-containing protein [Helicobacter sp.]
IDSKNNQELESIESQSKGLESNQSLNNQSLDNQSLNNIELKPQPLQPYPISYKDIPAELAWEMNLPLVRGYRGVWLYNSCAGGEATQTFFNHCEGIEFCTICWRFKAYKNAYIYLYQKYLQGQNILFSFNAWQEGAEKFANLLDKKVPIFSITRDYISRLKTGVNHISSTESITNKFKNFSLEDEIVFPKIYYRGAYKTKPDINIIQTHKNFSLQWGDFGGLSLKLDWLRNATSEVCFIPIDEISGERAFHTFVHLSKKLNFNVPQNPKAFSGKVNRYEGLLMLPCTLRVDAAQILITTYQLHPNNDGKLIDITSLINIKISQENLVLYTKDYSVLINNKT